jgi:hypothetical protein
MQAGWPEHAHSIFIISLGCTNLAIDKTNSTILVLAALTEQNATIPLKNMIFKQII